MLSSEGNNFKYCDSAEPRRERTHEGEIKMTVPGITETALYLTFQLEEESFALNVAQVREVLDLSTITKVPRAPDFMRGVINVRGSVVPVMDLRMKFGMPQAQSTVDTRIMIMEVTLEDKTIVIGAIADSVNDVLELEPGQIEDPPEIGARWRSEFIKGIGKRGDQFIIIIDIDRVFSSDDLVAVQGKAELPAQDSEKGTANPEIMPSPTVMKEPAMGTEAPVPV